MNHYSSPIPQIFFTREALNQMVQVVKTAPETETGGLVLGKPCWRQGGRVLMVTKLTGPGPHAVVSREGFRPDMAYYREVLAQESGLTYFGEWHKHPPGLVLPSQQDISQALEILRQEEHGELLCPLCTVEENGGDPYQIHCFYLQSNATQFLPLAHAVIDAPLDEILWQFIAVEARVLKNFLASGERTRMIPGDLYPLEGVAQFFRSPRQGNISACLVRALEPGEVAFPESVPLAIAVRGVREKNVRFFAIHPSPGQEISGEVIDVEKGVPRRNRALLETRILRNKHVAILGVGSIGSVAALELVRAGVGAITLLDPQRLAIENLSRHVCDLSDVGRYKVHAVAGRIRHLLPETAIYPLAINANADPEATLQACRPADCLLVATDTENSQRLANWLAWQLEIPLIYAGVLERAVGGRVWRVLPGRTACYDCYPTLAEKPVLNPIPYSNATATKELHLQPGLSNDIAFITHLAVRFCLESLKDRQAKMLKELPYDLMFWFNRAKPGWAQGPCEIYHLATVPPNPDCPTCRTWRKS